MRFKTSKLIASLVPKLIVTPGLSRSRHSLSDPKKKHEKPRAMCNTFQPSLLQIIPPLQQVHINPYPHLPLKILLDHHKLAPIEASFDDENHDLRVEHRPYKARFRRLVCKRCLPSRRGCVGRVALLVHQAGEFGLGAGCGGLDATEAGGQISRVTVNQRTLAGADRRTGDDETGM